MTIPLVASAASDAQAVAPLGLHPIDRAMMKTSDTTDTMAHHFMTTTCSSNVESSWLDTPLRNTRAEVTSPLTDKNLAYKGVLMPKALSRRDEVDMDTAILYAKIFMHNENIPQLEQMVSKGFADLQKVQWETIDVEERIALKKSNQPRVEQLNMTLEKMYNHAALFSNQGSNERARRHVYDVLQGYWKDIGNMEHLLKSYRLTGSFLKRCLSEAERRMDPALAKPQFTTS